MFGLDITYSISNVDKKSPHNGPLKAGLLSEMNRSGLPIGSIHVTNRPFMMSAGR